MLIAQDHCWRGTTNSHPCDQSSLLAKEDRDSERKAGRIVSMIIRAEQMARQLAQDYWWRGTTNSHSCDRSAASAITLGVSHFGVGLRPPRLPHLPDQRVLLLSLLRLGLLHLRVLCRPPSLFLILFISIMFVLGFVLPCLHVLSLLSFVSCLCCFISDCYLSSSAPSAAKPHESLLPLDSPQVSLQSTRGDVGSMSIMTVSDNTYSAPSSPPVPYTSLARLSTSFTALARFRLFRVGPPESPTV